MAAGYRYKRQMGLSKMGDEVQQSPREEDWGLCRARDWKLIRSMRFRTCFLTGQQLFGKRCYMGTRVITGPGTPVIEHYFVEKFEFMKWQLTRT